MVALRPPPFVALRLPEMVRVSAAEHLRAVGPSDRGADEPVVGVAAVGIAADGDNVAERIVGVLARVPGAGARVGSGLLGRLHGERGAGSVIAQHRWSPASRPFRSHTDFRQCF